MTAEHASTTATERTGALRAIRVIDFGHSIAAPLAGVLLADQGATVIQVERPQGEPARVHPAFATWNRGKQSVVLDLQTPDALIGFRGLMLLRCPRSGTHF